MPHILQMVGCCLFPSFMKKRVKISIANTTLYHFQISAKSGIMRHIKLIFLLCSVLNFRLHCYSFKHHRRVFVETRACLLLPYYKKYSLAALVLAYTYSQQSKRFLRFIALQRNNFWPKDGRLHFHQCTCSSNKQGLTWDKSFVRSPNSSQ